MSYQTLVHKVKTDLAHNTSLRDACLNILKKVSSEPEDSFRHITYIKLSELAELRTEDENFVNLVSYLCGDRVELFNLNMEYIDPETDYNFILNEENAAALKEENIIAHPKTGEEIQSADKSVFVFFSLNKEVGL